MKKINDNKLKQLKGDASFRKFFRKKKITLHQLLSQPKKKREKIFLYMMQLIKF